VNANLLVISAAIAEAEALRYTPAGIPALNLVLEHESEVLETGAKRQVKAVLKAMAFGALAERLVKQSIGSRWEFKGFLAKTRHGKTVVLHSQEFSQI